MPFATIDGVRIFYVLEGDVSNPVLVLSGSLGGNYTLWEQQLPDLLPHFRVLHYDIRGHGASEAPQGEYSIEMLGREVLGLADTLGISKFAFCGISLGGMIGQWLGIHARQRLTGLVLANTTAKVHPQAAWEERRRIVLEGGMATIVEASMQRFFTPEFLAEGGPYVHLARKIFLATDPVGFAGCCSAIRDMDHTKFLASIRTQTLVIAGDRDQATPWQGRLEIVARGIPGARVVHLSAGHLPNIETPREFTSAVLGFLLAEAAESATA